MSNLPKRLASWELICACLPDLICLYRILAAVVVVVLGLHPAAPWLFSTALISDLFDGWFWRRYSQHYGWFAKRPYLPLDPWADFMLILSGAIYAAYYWLQLNLCGVIGVLVLIVIVAIILHIIPYIGSPSRKVYTICNTFMTHISCFVMLATAVIVWLANSPSWYGPIVTLTVFYAVFGLIGDKSRLIRRPPPGWQGLP